MIRRLLPRFAAGESGLVIGRCCGLVAPLRYGGEVYGVVYLENRERVDSFSPESRALSGRAAGDRRPHPWIASL